MIETTTIALVSGMWAMLYLLDHFLKVGLSCYKICAELLDLLIHRSFYIFGNNN